MQNAKSVSAFEGCNRWKSANVEAILLDRKVEFVVV